MCDTKHHLLHSLRPPCSLPGSFLPRRYNLWKNPTQTEQITVLAWTSWQHVSSFTSFFSWRCHGWCIWDIKTVCRWVHGELVPISSCDWARGLDHLGRWPVNHRSTESLQSFTLTPRDSYFVSSFFSIVRRETQGSLYPPEHSSTFWEIPRRSQAREDIPYMFPLASSGSPTNAWKTSKGRCSGGILINLAYSFWSRGGSVLSYPWMMELLTFSWRLSPSILWRKLISAAWIQELVFWVMSHTSRPGEGWNK